MNVSSFDKAVVKIDSDTLKKIIKEKLSNSYYDECFSEITYFDNKILCIKDYISQRPHNHFYDYNIVSLETGKRLNNTLEDLVDYNDKFIEFIKEEFIEYYKNRTGSDFYDDYDFDLSEQSCISKFIFNNDGTIEIYHEHFPYVERNSNSLTIEMKKLKPYIKKDSIYRYLFD